jgi:hypothetical protein
MHMKCSSNRQITYLHNQHYIHILHPVCEHQVHSGWRMSDQIPQFQDKDMGGKVCPLLCEDPRNSLQYICKIKVNSIRKHHAHNQSYTQHLQFYKSMLMDVHHVDNFMNLHSWICTLWTYFVINYNTLDAIV